MQAMPPETTEKRTLVAEATTPASTFPSAGALATCASSMPETPPRISSGVAVSTVAEECRADLVGGTSAPAYGAA